MLDPAIQSQTKYPSGHSTLPLTVTKPRALGRKQKGQVQTPNTLLWIAALRPPVFEVFSGAHTVQTALPHICSWKSVASATPQLICCNNPHILFPVLNLPYAARPEKILILVASVAMDRPQDTGQNPASLQLTFTRHRRGIKTSRLLQEMSRQLCMKSSVTCFVPKRRVMVTA